jgi:hypothetical protein
MTKRSFPPLTQAAQQVVSDVDQTLHLHINFLCITMYHKLSFQKKINTTIKL